MKARAALGRPRPQNRTTLGGHHLRLRVIIPVVSTLIVAGCAGGTVKDVEGNDYPVVSIGSQHWMGTSLRVTSTADGRALRSYPPNGDTSLVRAFGLLYDWEAAQAACMAGWHLPTDGEWEQLSQWLGAGAGNALKDTTYWIGSSAGTSRHIGFGARPAGYWSGGQFESLFGRVVVFWSATAADTHFVWTRSLAAAHDTLRRVQQHPDFGLSVRCVRDS